MKFSHTLFTQFSQPFKLSWLKNLYCNLINGTIIRDFPLTTNSCYSTPPFSSTIELNAIDTASIAPNSPPSLHRAAFSDVVIDWSFSNFLNTIDKSIGDKGTLLSNQTATMDRFAVILSEESLNRFLII